MMKYINILAFITLLIILYLKYGDRLNKTEEEIEPVIENVSSEPILNDDEIYKVVDEMPRFPGCEDIGDNPKNKENCAKGRLLEYIYSHLKYPKVARENGIEGMAVIQFVVDKNGNIRNEEIVRDLQGGCGQASLEVVKNMSRETKWSPGLKDGVPVNVSYTLPIRFKLQE